MLLVWRNQQRLEGELRVLQRESHQLCVQAQSWVQMYESFHASLKALGDVENWADVLRADMAVVSATIEGARRAQAEPAPGGGSEHYTPLSVTPRTRRSVGAPDGVV